MQVIQDEITEIKGIGASTASVLALHGIKTIRDLAMASISQLIAIPGFSEFRARQVKFDAESVLKKLDSSKEANDRLTAKAKSAAKKPAVSSVVKSEVQPDITEKRKKDKKKSKQKDKDKSTKKPKKKDKSKDKSAKKKSKKKK